MNKIVNFTDEADRQRLEIENANMFLIEIRYGTTENTIIFSDTKPIETQLKEQADNQLTIMEALADIYLALPPMV